MVIEQITTPAELPISLSLVKQHLRIIGTDEDTTLQNLYIPSASTAFTSLTGVVLLNTQFQQTMDGFQSVDYILFGRHPIVSLDSFQYLSKTTELWTDVDSDLFRMTETVPKSLELKTNKTWPTDIEDGRASVKIVFTAGYGTTEASIPIDIKEILSLMIGDFFLFREDSISAPGSVVVNSTWSSSKLLQRYKIHAYDLNKSGLR